MQRDAGSSREPCCRSTMSQHVPMSPRPRTAADIIIVYSRRPWESGRHCAFPLWFVASSSWVKVVCSAASVRGTRVLSAAGVSSLRSDSGFLRRCVVYAAGCDAHCPTTTKTLPLRTTGPAAARTLASDARTRDCTRALPATTIWFRSFRRLEVVEDARRGIRI